MRGIATVTRIRSTPRVEGSIIPVSRADEILKAQTGNEAVVNAICNGLVTFSTFQRYRAQNTVRAASDAHIVGLNPLSIFTIEFMAKYAAETSAGISLASLEANESVVSSICRPTI
jgi:hypothetical protein